MGFIKPLLQETIKWLLSISWLLYNSSDSWAQNSFKTALLTLGSMVTYLILTVLSNLGNIKRPIHIAIQFENAVTKDSFTYYHEKSENNQAQRTVRMIVTVSKRSSFLTSLVSKVLAGKECWINIDALCKGDFILQCNDNLMIEKADYGLRIQFSDLLKEMLRVTDAELKHEIDFSVFKSREAGTAGNRNIDIVPICYLDEEKMKFWHKLLYKIDIEPHKIRYFAS